MIAAAAHAFSLLISLMLYASMLSPLFFFDFDLRTLRAYSAVTPLMLTPFRYAADDDIIHSSLRCHLLYATTANECPETRYRKYSNTYGIGI